MSSLSRLFYAVSLLGLSFISFFSSQLQANDWRLKGFLQTNLFADTIYKDPYVQAHRTPVFGDDGSRAVDADNSCVPTGFIAGSAEIEECRDLYLDGPEFHGGIAGSRLSLSQEREKNRAMLEVGFFSFTDPYSPQLSQLWLERGTTRIGYDGTAFMSSYSPMTLDYGGAVGGAYKRQTGVRMQLTPKLSLAFEESQNEIYLGLLNYAGHHNHEAVISSLRLITADDATYQVNNRLRERATAPDIIMSYHKEGARRDLFASLLLQYVRLDNNAPLFLDEDPGLLQLIDDAAISGKTAIMDALDRELRLNDDLSGGMYTFDLGLHLGLNLPVKSKHNMHLAYIRNGGNYLRDNPNPAHIVIPNAYNCRSRMDVDCEYRIVNIMTHSYLLDLRLAGGLGWILSGTITDDEYANYLGGSSTENLHSMHINYRQRLAGEISAAYELGYLYHATFNGRDNANYPRIRFQYALYYEF